jgi:7-carboxy-7-deazaguanine synthase
VNAIPETVVADTGRQRLKITEIFFSLQGEAATVGWPTVFVRLTGCPLRCTYCDTAYAFTGGQWMEFDAILNKVAGYKARFVTVTGGEPLAQSACSALLTQLCDQGYSVSLETSGAMDISDVDPRVCRVVDIKTPGSAEQHRNRWENLVLLTHNDQIKFVICNREDYDWAKSIVNQHNLLAVCDVLFSPSHQQLDAKTMAEWILQDRLGVRFQVQLHKYLWGDVPGH